MEYCATTLRQAIDSGRLAGRRDAWRPAPDHQALAYLHGLKLVHRDLKPANVCAEFNHWRTCSSTLAQNARAGRPASRRCHRDGTSQVKLGDLGLATTVEDDDRAPARDLAAPRPASSERSDPGGGGCK
ncbi:eukaryotic translation initiation factor 2-alpha kinase [Aureococcus anophagefferens]|nr:eukaryotic translation initiation factor 2-alpha kinase [Aureococcus anophagefferens]